MQKRLSQHFQFQVNYQLSEDLADDDNERDPFSYRYAVANNFKPDYGFSDRNERHRFNAFGLWQAPWGIEFSPLISFHTPQPISVGVTPADRVLANGYIIRRNSLWKDNTFFALDFRAAKSFRLSERFRLQFIVDAFNLTNRANPKHPETTSLLFNFDGTVQSGLGDPRQAQLGLRVLFLRPHRPLTSTSVDPRRSPAPSRSISVPMQTNEFAAAVHSAPYGWPP